MTTASSSDTTTVTTANIAIPLLSSFEEVKNAFNDHDYDNVIRKATDTIARIQQLELLSLLERRAHALSMKSKFRAAAQDAQTMVEYAPTLPQGYLCLGKLLSMQGKQTAALKVYQEGLENVPNHDPTYEQLLQDKKTADEKNNHHFDLLSALPLEVMDEIVTLLSEQERSQLFNVSTTWSRRLENCQEAWRNIYNEHGHDGNTAVSQVLPNIAKHISHLTITTTLKEVWLKYLEHLENGDFTSLKSLELTGAMLKCALTGNSVISLINGFWNTRYTLTKITFTSFYRDYCPITITDILFYLPYLETLDLSAAEPLAAILGELESLQQPHCSLVDLTLSTSSTSGDALKPLTRWCPYVRRLRLEYATPRALDVVNDYLPNVEMLGYNNGYELPPSHEVLNQNYNNKPITPRFDVNNMYIKEKQGRLRAFYSNNGGQGVPGDEFLRLLQKNQKTLEILHANMSMTREQGMNEEPYGNYRPDYARKAANIMLNLDRLEKITFWPDIYGVYGQLFCQIVGPSLKYFESFGMSDFVADVDTLINSQPQLETLKLSNICVGSDKEKQARAVQCLLRLLNEYSATSLPGTGTTTKLTNIMFDSCYFISDDVLDALANIKTIKGVGFQGDNRITYDGLINFFVKLKKQNVQITTLRLGGMEDAVDSEVALDIVDTMDDLEELYLEDIKWLTGDDIKAMIDSAKKLDVLTVKQCDVTSEDIITFVNNRNRNFKHIEITGYDSDDDDYDDDDYDDDNYDDDDYDDDDYDDDDDDDDND